MDENGNPFGSINGAPISSFQRTSPSGINATTNMTSISTSSGGISVSKVPPRNKNKKKNKDENVFMAKEIPGFVGNRVSRCTTRPVMFTLPLFLFSERGWTARVHRVFREQREKGGRQEDWTETQWNVDERLVWQSEAQKEFVQTAPPSDEFEPGGHGRLWHARWLHQFARWKGRRLCLPTQNRRRRGFGSGCCGRGRRLSNCDEEAEAQEAQFAFQLDHRQQSQGAAGTVAHEQSILQRFVAFGHDAPAPPAARLLLVRWPGRDSGWRQRTRQRRCQETGGERSAFGAVGFGFRRRRQCSFLARPAIGASLPSTTTAPVSSTTSVFIDILRRHHPIGPLEERRGLSCWV